MSHLSVHDSDPKFIADDHSMDLLDVPDRTALKPDSIGSKKVVGFEEDKVHCVNLCEVKELCFQKIEVLPGLSSSGWSNPAVEKLPYYGLPDDLTGMRVLDIGCAEGFFSFEAERRGAR